MVHPWCWYNHSLHFPRNKPYITNPYHQRKCNKLFQNQRHHAQPKWHRFDSTGLPVISHWWNQFSLLLFCTKYESILISHYSVTNWSILGCLLLRSQTLSVWNTVFQYSMRKFQKLHCHGRLWAGLNPCTHGKFTLFLVIVVVLDCRGN